MAVFQLQVTGMTSCNVVAILLSLLEMGAPVGCRPAATLQIFIAGPKGCDFCHGFGCSPANCTQVALDCALLWLPAGITVLIRDRFQKQQQQKAYIYAEQCFAGFCQRKN